MRVVEEGVGRVGPSGVVVASGLERGADRGHRDVHASTGVALDGNEPPPGVQRPSRFVDRVHDDEGAMDRSEALGWQITEEDGDEGEYVIAPPEGTDAGLGEILFIHVPEDKAVKNRLHLDLRPDDQAAEVARFEQLGARHVDSGSRPTPHGSCSPTRREST